VRAGPIWQIWQANARPTHGGDTPADGPRSGQRYFDASAPMRLAMIENRSMSSRMAAA
jgi:hypothetical protein